MSRIALLAGLGLLLAACAAQPPGVRPVAAGESRKDGIVTMASSGTLYNPVSPDWRPAQTAADRRCRRWGHDGSTLVSGWQEACRLYDLHGRCTKTTVTRFYSCSDEG
jgi:hypothetical protein